MDDFVLFLITGAFLYLLPGFLLLEALQLAPSSNFLEKIGLASSFSLALYPLFFLWGFVVGLRSMTFYLLLPQIFCLSLFIFVRLAKRRKKIYGEERGDGQAYGGETYRAKELGGKEVSEEKKNTNKWKEKIAGRKLVSFLVALSAVILLFYPRWAATRGMVAPSWGDSVHHTLIVKLILDHKGLFQSWSPYAPLESLTYHFGLHADVALWAWLTGTPAHQALLQAGQFLNGLAVLALFPVALRIGGSIWAAWAAFFFAGFLFPLPAFYVNWGRYTQLAGQVILPGILWTLDRFWSERTQPKVQEKKSTPVSLSSGLSLMLSGLALTHYRVAALAIVALIAWSIWALGNSHFRFRFWLSSIRRIGLAILSFLILILPWLWIAGRGRWTFLFLKLGLRPVEGSAKIGRDIWVWQRLEFYFPVFFAVAGFIILGLGVIIRRRLAVPLILFCGLSFLLANPDLIHLRHSFLLANETLILAIYIPLSLVWGWGLGLVASLIILVARIKKPLFYPLLFLFLSLIFFRGVNYQAKIVKPFFSMVTPNDLAVFDWIKRNTPRKAKFLINGFINPADKSIAVGSDAGWWLPYFTGRQTTIPPALYRRERLKAEVKPEVFVELIKKVRQVKGDYEALRKVLREEGVNYIYLGDKRGRVSYEPGELIAAEMLKGNDAFRLGYKKGGAQVWLVSPGTENR